MRRVFTAKFVAFEIFLANILQPEDYCDRIDDKSDASNYSRPSWLSNRNVDD